MCDAFGNEINVKIQFKINITICIYDGPVKNEVMSVML
jgi:hypothetical protein